MNGDGWFVCNLEYLKYLKEFVASYLFKETISLVTVSMFCTNILWENDVNSLMSDIVSKAWLHVQL